jgi:D-alanine-D-alanine ligase
MHVGFCFNRKRDLDPSLPPDFYAECDDDETIEAVRSALGSRHQVTPIEGDEEAFETFRRLRPDMVFNIAEGLYGEDRESQIPSMLEMLRIPYTGSDPLTLALCLNKAMTKAILSFHRIPTPAFAVVRNLESKVKLPPLPLIVKPLAEGSSKGVTNTALVRNKKQLREQIEFVLTQYRQPALIEAFLPGREFTAAILGNGDEAQVLPLVEIQFAELPPEINPIYSFEAKWIWDTVEKPLEIFACPARISSALRKKIETVCLSAYAALRVRDWCRIDLRLDEHGVPYILELNPLPGILPNPDANSCFPKAARTAGISYRDLIHRVLNTACRRIGMKP